MAAAQAGAALTALEKLAARPDTSLPVDELAAAIPFSSIALFDLALQVEGRRLAAARLTGAPPAELANMLLRVSARCGNAGDRAGALASVTEAVELYRALAAANPAAFRPGLAGSLNNLSNQQSDAGDRAGTRPGSPRPASGRARRPR